MGTIEYFCRIEEKGGPCLISPLNTVSGFQRNMVQSIDTSLENPLFD